jgi:hypothetical protein
MNPVTKFMCAALAAIVLLIAGAMMDGPTELEAAQAVADSVTELEYTAMADNGGVAFCKQFGRVPHLRPDGDLICRLGAPVVAQGGAQ